MFWGKLDLQKVSSLNLYASLVKTTSGRKLSLSLEYRNLEGTEQGGSDHPSQSP